MKLYHIKDSYGSDRIVISSDRSAFYSFRDKGGRLCPLRKIFSDSSGWSVVSSEDGRRGICLRSVEIDYGKEFSYHSFNEPIDTSIMCDYTTVVDWLNKNNCRLLPGAFSRYGVSINGRVYRVFDKFGKLNPKPLKSNKTSRGYYQISILGIDSSRKYALVHRLVAYMFLGIDWDSKLDIDHINGKKNDNRLKNIRVCSRSENLKYFRDRVVRMHIKHGRDVTKTARAMNITKEKVIESLSMEGVSI